MLLPKRVKYRRVHRGRLKGKAYRGNKVTYGDFGLQALEPSWITSNQIEAARIAMTRYIKRGGQVWIKIFPDKPTNRKGTYQQEYIRFRRYSVGKCRLLCQFSFSLPFAP